MEKRIKIVSVVPDDDVQQCHQIKMSNARKCVIKYRFDFKLSRQDGTPSLPRLAISEKFKGGEALSLSLPFPAQHDFPSFKSEETEDFLCPSVVALRSSIPPPPATLLQAGWVREAGECAIKLFNQNW